MATTLTLNAISNVLLRCTDGDNVILEGATVDFYWAAGHHVKFSGRTHGDPGAVSDWINAVIGGYQKFINIHRIGDRIPLYYYPGSVPVWTTKQYAVGNIVIGDGSGLGYEDVYRCISAHFSQASDRPVSGANWNFRWTMDNSNVQDTGERFFLIHNSL